MIGREGFKILLADLSVEMMSTESYTENICKDFIFDSDLPSDIIARASEDEISGEMARNPYVGRAYCESLCLYRAVAEQLPLFDRFVFHGAAIGVDDKAFVFAAPSGVGKSTHVGLWKRCFGEAVTVINGDKPIVGKDGDSFRVYSSPWAGKEGWKTNVSMPLKGICFLKRGIDNMIVRKHPSELFEEIINQIYVPVNGEMLQKTLNMFDEIAKQVPFYLMECNVSEQAAIMSFDTMCR